jgi:hypothetical protein
MPSPNFVRSRPDDADEVGVANTAVGVRAEEFGEGPIRITRLTLTNVPITHTDNGATGSGGVKIYDFPEGVITLLGGVADLDFELETLTDSNFVYAVGTATAGADGTLTSTEANIVASTAAALTSGAGTGKGEGTTLSAVNGADTALDAFLNIASSTDPSTANDCVVNGVIQFAWICVGTN